MIKLKSHEGTVRIGLSGSPDELTADICCALKAFLEATEGNITMKEINKYVTMTNALDDFEKDELFN